MAKISTVIGQGFATLLMVGLGCTANGETPNDVVAIGPLELVEATSVTVLARSFRINDTAGLVVGDKVAVHGTLQPDGSVMNAWAESLGAYTAGSDPVFETGVVTGVNESFGRLIIGDSKIDYTATLSGSGSAAPAMGEMIAVTGIQPTLGGVILGTTTNAGTTEVQIALAGTGVRGGNHRGHYRHQPNDRGHTGTSRTTAGHYRHQPSDRGNTGTSRTTAGITGTNRATAGITGSNASTAGITGTSRTTARTISGSYAITAGITG